MRGRGLKGVAQERKKWQHRINFSEKINHFFWKWQGSSKILRST